MKETDENGAAAGMLEQTLHMIGIAGTEKKRVVSVAKLVGKDHAGKDHVFRITTIVEPAMYLDTLFPDDAPFTTGSVEELKIYDKWRKGNGDTE